MNILCVAFEIFTKDFILLQVLTRVFAFCLLVSVFFTIWYFVFVKIHIPILFCNVVIVLVSRNFGISHGLSYIK